MWLFVIIPVFAGTVGITEDCKNVPLCGLLPWSEWSTCSETCGGGYQTRKREICGLGRWDEDELKEQCGNPLRKDFKVCNMNCLNNGTFMNDKCICTPGKTGRCCERAVFSLENLITSKQKASSFLRNRGPRQKRDDHIYEECRESGSCEYEEVREWIEIVFDIRGVCEWMKDRRCKQRNCAAGYSCVTRVRDCTLLSSYEVGCQDINECASNPCVNGGTCHNLINRFTCSCPPGYYGTQCKYDKDECASNPCLNGGECVNLINRFICSCKNGYFGYRCQHERNECSINPCLHGGTCHNLISRFYCSCLDGYYGPRCEHDKDECASNPCLHGATCHNLINKFTCSCSDGFQGKQCEYDIDECASDPCFNGGICHNLRNKFVCLCLDGYYGTQCEHDINECASNPCINGGTCHNLRNKFTCSCLDEYYGTQCELECKRPKYCEKYKCTTEEDFICKKCIGQGETPRESVYFISSDQKTCTDRSPPHFTNCPSEMVQKYDSGKGSYVNWEPIHVKENTGNFSLSSNIQNGAFLSFGDHLVVYNAIDDSGNMNNCSFTVRVIEIPDEICSTPPVPFHGFLGCQNKGALKCSINSCDEGYLLKNNDTYTCENGVWNPEFQEDFLTTSCIKPEPHYLRRNYTFTFNCPHLKINAVELRDCIKQSGLCPNGDVLLCDRPFQRIEGQHLSSKKLQIWMTMEGKISNDIDEQQLVQQMDAHGQNIIDLFQTGMFLDTCLNLACDFGDITGGQISEVCAEGSTFFYVNGQVVCGKCGPGWFYANDTCFQCPVGFYQDRSGQQTCKRCPDERMSMQGAFSISHCFAELGSRKQLPPSDSAGVVGGAIGGLFLVMLLIAIIVTIQRRRKS